MVFGLSVAEGIINAISNNNENNIKSSAPTPVDPRKERLRNSICYADPMVAFHNLTPENQQKVLAWAKEHNLTIEEVIRKVIDR
jgi:NRPS condensation-like uncharacterized protein